MFKKRYSMELYLISPYIVSGIVMIPWVIYGSMTRFERYGKLASRDILKTSGLVMQNVLILMYFVIVAICFTMCLFCCSKLANQSSDDLSRQ